MKLVTAPEGVVDDHCTPFRMPNPNATIASNADPPPVSFCAYQRYLPAMPVHRSKWPVSTTPPTALT